MAAIGFPLTCAQQVAERIPASAALLIAGRRSHWGLQDATGHG